MGRSPYVHASLEAFRRGSVDLLEERELVAKLEKSSPERGGLRVKFGMDPSSADLHVGHAVVLLKLRDLQRLGHTVVLIVGDATAMVGDPSGRNKLRPQLSRQEVQENLLTYTAQAGLLLDLAAAEVRRNSQWFDAMRFEDLLRLLGRRTVAQTLAREDFQKRLAENTPVGLHELVYPVMQGWDSVEVRADVELGGTDQLFNLLVGRDLQLQEKQEPQVVLTTPLVNGLDGRKMSKSYGNTIGLTDGPDDVFGKTMSIVDQAMPLWFELLTRVPDEERKALLAGHPRQAKARLASELVALLHGPQRAEEARVAFDRRFVQKLLPDDIPVRAWPDIPVRAWPHGEYWAELPILLHALGLATSNSDARRKIEGGGVRLNGVLIKDPKQRVRSPEMDNLQEHVIQVGKRHFVRVRPK